MITHDEAHRLLEERISDINLRRHMLATQAVLAAVAVRLGQDAEMWGLTGLLHDIDLEAVDGDMTRHAAVAADWLAGKLPPEATQAILAHNGENLAVARTTALDHALAASETITGLIVAAALVLPSRKLGELKVKSVRKRMKEPRFAAGANRETIRECEQLGIPVEEFVELAVEAMRPLGPELGL